MRFRDWLVRYRMDPDDVSRICAVDSGAGGVSRVFVRRVRDLKAMYDACQCAVDADTQIHLPDATMRDSEREIE